MQNHSNDNFIDLNLEKISDEEEDHLNLISIHLSSDIITINFHQFCKYSRLIQKEFQEQTCISDLITKIEIELKKYNIKDESVKFFFKLLNDQSISIACGYFFDLYKLSHIFKVNSVRKFLKKNFSKFSQNLDFVLNLLVEQQSNDGRDLLPIDFYSIDVESFLSENIENCLKSDKFGELSFSSIYRIIEKSDKNKIKSDTLFDFIWKSIEERCLLLQFLDIKRLSDEKFDVLCQKNSMKYIQFLNGNIDFLNELKHDKKKLESEIIKLNEDKNRLERLKYQKDSEIHKLQTDLSNLKETNVKIQSQINQLLDENKDIKQKMADLSKKQLVSSEIIQLLRGHFSYSEKCQKARERFHKAINDSKDYEKRKNEINKEVVELRMKIQMTSDYLKDLRPKLSQLEASKKAAIASKNFKKAYLISKEIDPLKEQIALNEEVLAESDQKLRPFEIEASSYASELEQSKSALFQLQHDFYANVNEQVQKLIKISPNDENFFMYLLKIMEIVDCHNKTQSDV